MAETPIGSTLLAGLQSGGIASCLPACGGGGNVANSATAGIWQRGNPADRKGLFS